MRFRVLLALVVLLAVEILLIASSFGVPFEIIVELATITALIFPLYSWERERLDKRYELVNEVRVWADHFYYMTKHLQQIPPNEIKIDEMVEIQKLADEIGTQLSEALARCVNIVGSDTELVKGAYGFIVELRKFARDDSLREEWNRFLHYLEKLQPTALDIGHKAMSEAEQFKVRYVVPQRLAQKIVLAALIACSITLLVLLLYRTIYLGSLFLSR